jgi:hypothetical protein
MLKRARVWQRMDGGMGMQRERRSQFVDPEMMRLRNSLDSRVRIENKKRSQLFNSKKRSQVPSGFDKESPKKNYFE